MQMLSRVNARGASFVRPLRTVRKPVGHRTRCWGPILLNSSPSSRAGAPTPAWAISRRVTSAVNARRVGSGNVAQQGALGGSAVPSANSSSCGFGKRRRGGGIAISLMAIARAYRSALGSLSGHRASRERLRHQRAQRRECRHRRLRPRRALHPPARGRVQHPRRQLLRPLGHALVEAAPRDGLRSARRHLMDAHRLAPPGMQRIRDHRVAPHSAATTRFMDLVS